MSPAPELVCVACGEPLIVGPKGEEDAWCGRGHRYRALRNGFDFVKDREPVHYPPRGIDQMARMQREHFWFVARRRLILDWIGQARDLAPGATFLDIGAGSGDVCALARRHGFRAVAADYHLEADRAVAASDESVPFHGVDVENLPFRGFDAVGLFDVLEHLDRPVKALESIRGTLRPGGWLLVTVPARPELWTNVDLYSGHRLRYDRKLLREQLRKAGFKIVRASYFMMLLVPPLVFTRTRGAWSLPDGLDEAGVRDRLEALTGVPAAPLNRAALAMLSLERFWLRIADLPYGSSIIALARRP